MLSLSVAASVMRGAEFDDSAPDFLSKFKTDRLYDARSGNVYPSIEIIPARIAKRKQRNACLVVLLAEFLMRTRSVYIDEENTTGFF